MAEQKKTGFASLSDAERGDSASSTGTESTPMEQPSTETASDDTEE